MQTRIYTEECGKFNPISAGKGRKSGRNQGRACMPARRITRFDNDLRHQETNRHNPPAPDLPKFDRFIGPIF